MELASEVSPVPATGAPPRPAGAPTTGTRVVLILASVVLLRLAFPPTGLAPLALVALAPFLHALRGLAPRAALQAGFAFGVLSGAANASWFASVFALPFAAVLWLILGLFPAAYAWGHARAARRGELALAVVAPALWVALDWVRSEGWHLRFAWFTLGHALGGDRFIRQSADLAGVYGLTLAAFVASLLLARAAAYGRRDGRAFVLGLLGTAVVLVLYARGNRMLGVAEQSAETRVGPGLRVIAVQDEHPDHAGPKIALTEKAVAAELAPPDVILWPEASFFFDTERAPAVQRELEIVANRARGAFIFGAARPVDPAEPRGRAFNAAVLLGPDGKRLGEYHKRVPVQFVESCTPGSDAPTFSVAGAKLGIMICYDGTYPFVTRELVQNGADVLLVPTMDMAEWGALQHAAHALFYPLRACEVRRPIVRAASSGVSLALDPWGREVARLEPFAPGTLAVTVWPRGELTPYVRGGWLLPHAALALVLLAAAAEAVASRRRAP